MEYEIHFLTDDNDIQFAQSGECKDEAEAINRAWYFLGFSNAPGLRLYVYPESDYTPEELRGGEPLATLRPLAKGSTAEREEKRNGTLKDWIGMFREEEDSPAPPTPYWASSESCDGNDGITDADIPF